MHFCRKIKGQRVCTFLRGSFWEDKEATPGLLFSTTRQRRMTLCRVKAVRSVMSRWEPPCLLVNSQLHTTPQRSLPSAPPGSIPASWCALFQSPLVTSFPQRLQGCYGRKPPLMLPSAVLCSWQVVVTNCPAVVAPRAPPEHWPHSEQRVVHSVRIQTMVHSALLQVKAPFVQIADLGKFFLRFCCSKLESPGQRQ